MKEGIYVWDKFVRTFHWSLVLLFVMSYFTGEENTTVHTYSGYAIATLVVARVIWGFIGTLHARFRDFVRPPGEVMAYTRNMLRGKPRRFIGHNPLGGLMTLALLASLSATTLSGMKLLAVEEGEGPFAMDTPASVVLISEAAADDERTQYSATSENHEDGEEFWEEVHELAVNATLALIALHVLGVVASSLLHRESLVTAMFTGYKQRDG